jgi:DNA polymerase
MIVFCDIETRSSTDVKMGVYRYSEDPDFQILMAAWHVDGEPTWVDTDSEVIHTRLLDFLDAGATFVAHNAQFERVCFSRMLGLPVGEYLPPEQWHDTMAVAGERGYPQSLGALAVALGAEPKDEAGTRLIKTFCVPKRGGGWVRPEDKPTEWADFIAYCAQDVDTMVDAHARLGDWPTAMERSVWIADQKINDRGMLIDTELAAAALIASDENRMLQELEMQQMTGMLNPGSGPQLTAWLESRGVPVPNLQAATIQSLIDGDLYDDVRRVLELRQELALVAAKKYQAALSAVSSDNRLRGTLRFFGAHTGRWTGRGAQPQNLPRASLDDDVAVEAAVLDLRMGLGADSETLKALVRPMFLGPMTVVDYAAIEARVLAWMANETWALDAFNAGRDIYTETAQRMGGLTRSQGKVACIAKGSKVLTDQGTIAIEDVTLDHRVWDGVDWVRHEGLVYRGVKDVITYGGLTATADHRVWIEGQAEPVHLGQAAAREARLVRSGDGRNPIRLGDDREFRETSPCSSERGGARTHSVQRLRLRGLDLASESSVGSFEGLSAVQSTHQSPSQNPREDERRDDSLHRSYEAGMGILRRTWYRVQVRVFGGFGRLGDGESRSAGRSLNRSDRQRRPLRAREHPLGHPVSADEQSAPHEIEGVSSRALALLGVHGAPQTSGGEDAVRDHRGSRDGCGREAEGMANHRGQARVYDLINSGPRHRFTVDGVLVHNCLALGYNGGIGSLRAMGAVGSDEMLEMMVAQWRRANRRIVSLWAKMNDAFRMGGPVGPHITVEVDGDDRYVRLPSGRIIGYHDCAFGSRATFSDPKRGGTRADTYGGRLVENATQAIARDILAEALVRLDSAGLEVVGHVHDEILVAGAHSVEAVSAIMTETPSWATGMPIDGAGYTCKRYKK